MENFSTKELLLGESNQFILELIRVRRAYLSEFGFELRKTALAPLQGALDLRMGSGPSKGLS